MGSSAFASGSVRLAYFYLCIYDLWTDSKMIGGWVIAKRRSHMTETNCQQPTIVLYMILAKKKGISGKFAADQLTRLLETARCLADGWGLDVSCRRANWNGVHGMYANTHILSCSCIRQQTQTHMQYTLPSTCAYEQKWKKKRKKKGRSGKRVRGIERKRVRGIERKEMGS